MKQSSDLAIASIRKTRQQISEIHENNVEKLVAYYIEMQNERFNQQVKENQSAETSKSDENESAKEILEKFSEKRNTPL